MDAYGIASCLVIEFQFTFKTCLILWIKAHIIKAERVGILPLRRSEIEKFHVGFAGVVPVGCKRGFPKIQESFPFLRIGECKIKDIQRILENCDILLGRFQRYPARISTCRGARRNIYINPCRIKLAGLKVFYGAVGNDVVYIVIYVRICLGFGVDCVYICSRYIILGYHGAVFTHKVFHIQNSSRESFLLGKDVYTA